MGQFTARLKRHAKLVWGAVGVVSTVLGLVLALISADFRRLALALWHGIVTLYLYPVTLGFVILFGSATGGLFEQMYHRFCLDREKYLEHYHKRSNIETTVSMIKMKFGGSVRSRLPVAMTNEAYCKVICHNICCLISAIYELGLAPEFWRQTPKPVPPDPMADIEERLAASAWI